jgi:hypothetical protein
VISCQVGLTGKPGLRIEMRGEAKVRKIGDGRARYFRRRRREKIRVKGKGKLVAC